VLAQTVGLGNNSGVTTSVDGLPPPQDVSRIQAIYLRLIFVL